MTPPTATYRLQLRGGMTFARAATLAPQLANLGISHLYLSPIFEAVSGSAHGYDVVDATVIDGVLGGETGFRTLANACRSHGIGLILDFVPNHMAASPQNPWWRDVLEWGALASARPALRHRLVGAETDRACARTAATVGCWRKASSAWLSTPQPVRSR